VKMAMGVSGSELGSGNSGLCIRLGSAGGTCHQLYLACWKLIRPSDGALMPPPPMPAFLDPTTISSTPQSKGFSSLAQSAENLTSSTAIGISTFTVARHTFSSNHIEHMSLPSSLDPGISWRWVRKPSNDEQRQRHQTESGQAYR